MQALTAIQIISNFTMIPLTVFRIKGGWRGLAISKKTPKNKRIQCLYGPLMVLFLFYLF